MKNLAEDEVDLLLYIVNVQPVQVHCFKRCYVLFIETDRKLILCITRAYIRPLPKSAFCYEVYEVVKVSLASTSRIFSLKTISFDLNVPSYEQLYEFLFILEKYLCKENMYSE